MREGALGPGGEGSRGPEGLGGGRPASDLDRLCVGSLQHRAWRRPRERPAGAPS